MNPDTGEIFEFCNGCGYALRADDGVKICPGCGAELTGRRKRSVIEEAFGDSMKDDLSEHLEEERRRFIKQAMGGRKFIGE